ncbi:dihydrolipoyl dehydrogenase [Azospirillum brasilense]|uniref:Dihydrolipoyl dehydrogenase n=1 Tax=Azospirillum brasilense TaxID=192 RepID=A0A0P0EP47_AZOBR|nr:MULTISPECIES: dihydrolipoyl dehydrogenase [Azospirillum]ALJ36046.1 dihydrolipoamide dehydrogenase [Azospirillum brasilense]MDW7552465.1 dihydrolipoyl dehydrogenase [Azospirillum brasilense]MDW7592345.1 dihydrolipoyl dehydrogenase [Azospirillum brasilense]MDW7627475.1 dihydrolipoyl dehydrogenase [Azospirillum brasilense]MDW7628960.1 dihydrolipoyl dehydrogenase [Azospirillum brasilense]
MAESTFDVVVVGGGPGGYVCAIRAAQLGFKVACVEKRSALGGTCLNVGCIPSKALLAASEKFEEAKHGLAKFGIKVGGVELDLPGMLSHKDKVVKENTGGIEFLFKKNKIAWLKGAGRITAPNTVEVEGVGTITASKAIVIATGSEVTPLPGIEIDEQKIVSSTGALELPEVPKRLVVIGGGVIGLELGSVWGRLGAQVTVVEFLDRILPTMDGEVSKQMQRILGKQGMTFKLGSKVTAAKVTNTGVTLSVEPAAGGTAEEVEADVVLVAIGRRAFTNGLGLDAVGVEMDNRGRVKIGKHFETNVPGIYAIGDVVEGPMLAHKAEEEGVALAELLAGQAGHVNHDLVPGVVYTWPEVAAVGKTEEELKAAGVAYKAGKFPFTANGRARASGTTDGFVKILADARTDKVLGVHMVGPNVSEMVGELGVAMEFSASAEDIARTCHAHPTLSEVTKEAALAVDGRALHI